MLARATLSLALLVLVASAVSCNISPQPVPPPEIRAAEVTVTEAAQGTLRVTGAAGAISPAPSTLRITNIGNVSGAAARVDTAVAADGSFSADLAGALGDRLKLRIVEGEERPDSIVVDTPGGQASEVIPIDCALILPDDDLVLAPETLVGSMSAVDVAVENNCADDINVTAVTLAFGNTDFVLNFMTPAVVAPDVAEPILLDYAPMAEGVDTDVLVIVIEQGGVVDTRVIDVEGESSL